MDTSNILCQSISIYRMRSYVVEWTLVISYLEITSKYSQLYLKKISKGRFLHFARILP
jgi:hypothetical protein